MLETLSHTKRTYPIVMLFSIWPICKNMFKTLKKIQSLGVVKISNLHHEVVHVPFCAKRQLKIEAYDRLHVLPYKINGPAHVTLVLIVMRKSLP